MAAHIYRLRIESIVEEMVGLAPARENLEAVAEYMKCLPRVTAVLRDLREPAINDELADADPLLELTHRIMANLEQAIKADLDRSIEELEYGSQDIVNVLNRGGMSVGRIEEVSTE